MLKNEVMNETLEVMLNKNRKNITIEDLQQIETIYFSKATQDGEQVFPIEEVLLLPNISVLSIASSMITQEDIEVLSQLPNLKSISFTRCIIEEDVDYSSLSALENLSISRSFINNYQTLSTAKTLKSLELFFPYNENDDDLNISDISSEETLEMLTLEGCDISNPTSFSKFTKVKTLNLLSTTVQHFDFVNHMNSLETIYVSPRYGEDKNLKKPNLIVQLSKAELVMDNVDGSKNLV
ncbi:MAG: hypothetical protein IJA30_04735 [Bacilli bacterium]|nr:hypothetical protein [Bacilli bacterium]